MAVHARAGQLPVQDDLIDVPRLITAYYTGRPDPAVPSQRVAFGTSGHRGSAWDNSFNEAHILAITQAICRYRRKQGIDGPLFLGIDTHALSRPAQATALEVLAANGVEVMLDARDGYTPTPVISHAILTYNRGRSRNLADGIVITPSHNPPQAGGIKYNPPHGGPAGTEVTKWIENEANALLAAGLTGVQRVAYERAVHAATTHRHQYVESYVDDLPQVVDMEAIAHSGIPLGVDPLGGASVAFWEAMAGAPRAESARGQPGHRSHLPLPDPGLGRSDPHGPVVGACHGRPHRPAGRASGWPLAMTRIPTASASSPPARACSNPIITWRWPSPISFANRPQWPASAGVGKTLVSSSLIDRVAAPQPPPGGGAGGIQVVRGRALGRLPGLRRRRERRRLLPAPGRHGLDHRQRRPHPQPPGSRNHRQDRPRSR
jgi:phosphoglucomutase